MHNSHKIIPITDEESLKKENIDINSALIEYNQIYQKTNNLIEKVKNEVNEINTVFDRVVHRTSKNFKICLKIWKLSFVAAAFFKTCDVTFSKLFVHVSAAAQKKNPNLTKKLKN